MPVRRLPSGLVVGFREWKFGDMQRWAQKAEDGGSGDDLLVEATATTLERVIDPGPYGFLKEDATALDVDRLLKVDVQWWLYEARRASHPDDPERKLTGDDFVFDWQCSQNPKHAVEPKVKKLSTLRHKRLPESSVENVRTGKPFTVKMPGGETVAFVLPTVGLDKPMRALMKKRTTELRRTKKGAKPVEPTQSEIVACQIVSVSTLGDNQSFDRRAEYIRDLPFKSWHLLEQAIRAAAPEINRKVECICDECHWKTEVPLPLTPGFFLPMREMAEEAETEADPEMAELEAIATETNTGDTSTPSP